MRSSLRKFERDLLDNLGKKALLIDERFNGGGGIDQELLEILNQRKKYESYRGRDSVVVPRPVETFYGPMAVLQNERSASDAEMFPEGFRTLGLGKLVGMPTYGAVIGTGSYRLLDGSTIRVPSVGVYTAKGQDFEELWCCARRAGRQHPRRFPRRPRSADRSGGRAFAVGDEIGSTRPQPG